MIVIACNTASAFSLDYLKKNIKDAVKAAYQSAAAIKDTKAAAAIVAFGSLSHLSELYRTFELEK